MGASDIKHMPPLFAAVFLCVKFTKHSDKIFVIVFTFLSRCDIINIYLKNFYIGVIKRNEKVQYYRYTHD